MRSDCLCVNTQSTPAYARMMAGLLPGERHRKRVRLAGARIRVDLLGAPTLLCGLPRRFPSPGMERAGSDAFVCFNGARIRGDGRMREALGIRPAVELIQEAEGNLPAWMWSGLGNIAMNQYCVAWQSGELYYSSLDLPLLAAGWEFDACMWIKAETWQVRFERVRFVRSGAAWEPLIGGEPVSNVKLIISGQRLVERGIPIDPAHDGSSRYAVSYVDTRHLALNAYTRLIDRKAQRTATDDGGQPIRKDFGLDQILAEPKLLKAAIEGHIVPLRLELQDIDGIWYDVAPEDLAAALAEKSYHLCSDAHELLERHRSGERGLSYIDEARGICHLVYQASPYPLHFVAARRSGDTVLIDAVVGGSSNGAGCTVAGLAKDLRSCGYEEALLLDNGGDVVFVHRESACDTRWADPNGPRAIVPSSLNRTRWAALMLYQGQTGIGIDVSHDSAGQGGRFCVEWK